MLCACRAYAMLISHHLHRYGAYAHAAHHAFQDVTPDSLLRLRRRRCLLIHSPPDCRLLLSPFAVSDYSHFFLSFLTPPFAIPPSALVFVMLPPLRAYALARHAYVVF